MSGKPNGHDASGEAQQQLQVNPAEVANLALMFLGRVDFRRHERQQFDLCEALLQAIAQGRVTLSQSSPRAESSQPAPASLDA